MLQLGRTNLLIIIPEIVNNIEEISSDQLYFWVMKTISHLQSFITPLNILLI